MRIFECVSTIVKKHIASLLKLSGIKTVLWRSYFPPPVPSGEAVFIGYFQGVIKVLCWQISRFNPKNYPWHCSLQNSPCSDLYSVHLRCHERQDVPLFNNNRNLALRFGTRCGKLRWKFQWKWLSKKQTGSSPNRFWTLNFSSISINQSDNAEVNFFSSR